jgi:hypothetical protein
MELIQIIELKDPDNFFYKEFYKCEEVYFNEEQFSLVRDFLNNTDKNKLFDSLIFQTKGEYLKDKKRPLRFKEYISPQEESIYGYSANFFDSLNSILSHWKKADGFNYIKISTISGFTLKLHGKRNNRPIIIKILFEKPIYCIGDLNYIPCSFRKLSKKVQEGHPERKILLDSLSQKIDIKKYKINDNIYEEGTIRNEKDSRIIFIKNGFSFKIREVAKLTCANFYSDLSTSPKYFEVNEDNSNYVFKQLLKAPSEPEFLEYFKFSKPQLNKMLNKWKIIANKRGMSYSFSQVALYILRYQDMTVDLYQKMVSLFRHSKDRTEFEERIKKDEIILKKLEDNKELKLVIMLQ